MKKIQSIPYPEYTTEQRDLLLGVIIGERIYNTDEEQIQEFDGTNWYNVKNDDSSLKFIIEEITENCTLTAEDSGKYFYCTSKTNVFVVLESGITSPITIYQKDSGAVYIEGDEGVDIYGLDYTAGQYYALSIIPESETSYLIIAEEKDDKNKFTELTLSNNEVVWDCETGLNKTLEADDNFELIIQNPINGGYGTLYLIATTALYITLPQDSIFMGDFSNLSAGNYVICFTYTGNNFLINIGVYEQ